MRVQSTVQVRERGHRVLAQLTPLYGATQKLMEHYRQAGEVDRVVKVSPGRGANAQAEEDPAVILEALEDAFALQEFSVLVCDQVGPHVDRMFVFVVQFGGFQI